MIRPNYTSLSNWSLEEYLDNYQSEKRMETIIGAGLFPQFIQLKAAEVFQPKQFIHIKPKQMPKVYILVGIPCSGKSTFSRTLPGWTVISRDEIRLRYFGKGYIHNSLGEAEVTDRFKSQLDTAIYHKTNIVVDNTHAREKYINEVLKRFEGTGYDVKIKFFDLPLCKAYYRNFVRRFREGKHKWIPMKVLKRFKENYDKINKIKYALYTT